MAFVWPLQDHVCHVGQEDVKVLAWEDQLCLFDQLVCRACFSTLITWQGMSQHYRRRLAWRTWR